MAVAAGGRVPRDNPQLPNPPHLPYMTTNRRTEAAVDPLFTGRWSPRSFTGEAIDEATLMGLFEAARWAPSAFNAQPWRFLYSRNGSSSWPTFLELLFEGNRAWAQRASALVLVVSKTTMVPPGGTEPKPSGTHSFDAGAAWLSLALQARIAGWYTHGMAGFDHEAARERLGVPADFHVEAMIAIGRRGDKQALPEALQAREQPNDRLPLQQLVAEGAFRF